MEDKIDTGKTLFIDTYNQATHEDVAPTITTRTRAANHHYISEPESADDEIRVSVATKKGYEVVKPGGCFDAQFPNSKLRRSRVKENGTIAGTIVCGQPPCYYEAKTGKTYRIRRLTERECFRLMGVPDDAITIIQSAKDVKGKPAVSMTQQYKLAGNSIVVDVLFYIFQNIYISKSPKEGEQLTLF